MNLYGRLNPLTPLEQDHWYIVFFESASINNIGPVESDGTYTIRHLSRWVPRFVRQLCAENYSSQRLLLFEHHFFQQRGYRSKCGNPGIASADFGRVSLADDLSEEVDCF